MLFALASALLVALSLSLCRKPRQNALQSAFFPWREQFAMLGYLNAPRGLSVRFLAHIGSSPIWGTCLGLGFMLSHVHVKSHIKEKIVPLMYVLCYYHVFSRFVLWGVKPFVA